MFKTLHRFKLPELQYVNDKLLGPRLHGQFENGNSITIRPNPEDVQLISVNIMNAAYRDVYTPDFKGSVVELCNTLKDNGESLDDAVACLFGGDGNLEHLLTGKSTAQMTLEETFTVLQAYKCPDLKYVNDNETGLRLTGKFGNNRQINVRLNKDDPRLIAVNISSYAQGYGTPDFKGSVSRLCELLKSEMTFMEISEYLFSKPKEDVDSDDSDDLYDRFEEYLTHEADLTAELFEFATTGDSACLAAALNEIMAKLK